MEDCKFNAGTKNTNTYTYTESPGTGVFDILIKYTTTADKWISIEINGKSFGDIFCPKTGPTKSVKEADGYLIITSSFKTGKNSINISGKSLPEIQGIHIMNSGVDDDSNTKFEDIHPSEDIDLSWNVFE